MTPRFFLLAVAAVSATPALAEGGISLAVSGGSLGVGPVVGLRASRLFGVHGDATFLNLSHHFQSSDVDYDGHLKLRSAGAMVDIFPFGGGFRISAGARYNGNTARATATPTANTSVGGQTFTPTQIGTLAGHGDVRKISPAATLGCGGRPGKGFMIGVEAGALFQGRVHVSDFTSSTGLIPQARLDTERGDLQHDADKYKIYPIVQLSVGWRL